MQARFLRISELLESFGPQRVGLPHVRPLGEKLWEMRLSGREGIGRAIYTAAAGRRLIVLHAFVKKTQKTPPIALNLPLKRLKESGSGPSVCRRPKEESPWIATRQT